MEWRHPSCFEPQLTDEVISFFAQHMLDINRDINYLLSTENEDRKKLTIKQNLTNV